MASRRGNLVADLDGFLAEESKRRPQSLMGDVGISLRITIPLPNVVRTCIPSRTEQTYNLP